SRRWADEVEDRGLLDALGHHADVDLPARIPGREVVAAVERGPGAVHHAVRVEGIDLQVADHPAELGRDLGRLWVGPEGQPGRGADVLHVAVGAARSPE